ncbi:Glycine dehydrogenase (decarboxylating), mitochondrial [Smittium mucronatum]|uniref:Glycine cleavage system P protein n=1 Tax=Smittium mucronatum TaxID=133383 RepID=A0A1R0GTP9_9FUNG|nr:Glycine dehydrogenase (decarboxylating), mitochondrial [Smittium mucronatum]
MYSSALKKTALFRASPLVPCSLISAKPLNSITLLSKFGKNNRVSIQTIPSNPFTSYAVHSEGSKKIVDNSYPSQDEIINSKRRLLGRLDSFPKRHIGPRDQEIQSMLNDIGFNSINELLDKAVPSSIRMKSNLEIQDGGLSETEMLSKLKNIAKKNRVFRSYIGTGYNGTILPSVILRSLLENPNWYTQYTPYQPEISQGRLESLLNFQTMIQDLTGLPMSNASLLDEGTAAGESLVLCINSAKKTPTPIFFADRNCHPQTIAVLKTRAQGFNTEIIVGDYKTFDLSKLEGSLVGALVSYPDTFGTINDYSSFSKNVHDLGAKLVVSADIMALTVLAPPSSFGADIAIGNSQRFGVSLGYGGPHAAFIATSDALKRKIPGRLVGVSIDTKGRTAYRLALQAREQHIRRDRATSNICTAQALLANISAMYAVYHGPAGLKNIANNIHRFTVALAQLISLTEHEIDNQDFFDTILVKVNGSSSSDIIKKAESIGINLRAVDDSHIGVSLDETVTIDDLKDLASVFGAEFSSLDSILLNLPETLSNSENVPKNLTRTTEILTHPVFHKYHSETEMLRYLTLLQNRDLSLANAIIPLGSCTMKLNGASEMIPITWPEFSNIHPFAPDNQALGYKKLIDELEADLCALTGLDGCSIQPNSGAQGEYTGLRTIRAYQKSINQGQRNICLVPTSAHGTNPASAVMANLKVVTVKCDSKGYLDLTDLKMKSEKYSENLSSVMITYPSTYGIFEEGIKEAIQIVHDNGGQVYMDGANLNAQIGITNPGDMGADVCHINNHKSLCVPHGGGGPGVGPICVKKHLIPFLPGHPMIEAGSEHYSKDAIGPVASAPFGSASILPISWAYIKMMGGDGLTKATEAAILNANYMVKRLRGHYSIKYTNINGFCAHEFIIDLNEFVKTTGIGSVDVAKRLLDYGIHSPTMSWPAPNSLMIEPTESESKQEIDFFCDAMISIRDEIREIESGKAPKGNNLLSNSPHPMEDLLSENWDYPYSRSRAAYPLPILKTRKFWPTISRVNDTYGDTNLVCSCPPVTDYE